MLRENKSAAASQSGHRRWSHQAAGAVLGSPVVWGGGLAVVFYAAIPELPFASDRLQRYFCSHPLEYALVGLFCIGMAILTRRLVDVRKERAALAALSVPSTAEEDDLSQRIATLEQHLEQSPPRLRRTVMHRRFRDCCEYLKGSRSISGLESRLKDLSDAAAERLHESYSLLLTINWAVPIIGFLGTVIGITLAIANVTPEQLDTSLNSVTGGLAVAFDTTTVAMSFSLVLVFAYDGVKRVEQRILARVDEKAMQEILPYVAHGLVDADPLTAAQTEAAQSLIERTDELVQEQTEVWREAVDSLRQRWSETLTDQRQQLAAGLNLGVEVTLEEHAAQLQQVREEFLAAFESAAQEFASTMEEDRESRQQREASAQTQLEQIWGRVRDDLHAVVRAHDAQTEDTVDRLVETMRQWESGIERSTRAVEAQLEQLQQLNETTLRLADQEQQLVSLQRTLSDNLQAVQAAETFEQTLHNLTAAVHLLTARTRPKAA